MSKINIEIDLDEYIADAASDMGEYADAPTPLAKYVLGRVTKELTMEIALDATKETANDKK